MHVRFWGVRGSTPTPQVENLRYGGNTSCVEVRLGEQIYIFDCGTGLRNLGKQLEREKPGQPIIAHVFLSHFHWDHIQGIPFFTPLYSRSDSYFFFHSHNRVTGLQRAIEQQMADPYFPVDMNQMAAHRNFYDIDEGRIAFENCVLQSAWLQHPQGCLGFRVESDDGVLVYATDNEPGHPDFDRAVRKLAEGADVLIYDAQYTPDEYQRFKRGWGHSHWREGIDIAMQSGAQELVLFHHDPDHSDAAVDAIVSEARNYYPKVRAAAEGMEIQLGVTAAAQKSVG